MKRNVLGGLVLLAGMASVATACQGYNVDPVTGVESDAGGYVPYSATFTGVPATANGQALASAVVKSKDRQYGVYFQDDWAVNNKLTFNLGVRYEFFGAMTDPDNRFFRPAHRRRGTRTALTPRKSRKIRSRQVHVG